MGGVGSEAAAKIMQNNQKYLHVCDSIFYISILSFFSDDLGFSVLFLLKFSNYLYIGISVMKLIKLVNLLRNLATME